MKNMLNYLAEWGMRTVDILPLGEVDLLIFSQLVHAPYEEIMITGALLTELKESVLKAQEQQIAHSALHRERAALWEAVTRSARFRMVRLAHFAHCFDKDEQTQFAAALFTLGTTAILAFRGTDGTVIGWKEDLNMSYAAVVPAQEKAVSFLREAVAMLPQLGCNRLALCGHSKGGNLAMYAASMCEKEVRDHIQVICAYDAPGLQEYVLSSPGFAEAQKRMLLYIPESSIIGLLLGSPGEKTVIASDNAGLMQHDPFNWHVNGLHFETVSQTTLSSRVIERGLQDYINKVPVQTRRGMVEGLFSIIEKTGANTVRQIPKAMLLQAAAVGEELGKMAERERGALTRLLSGFGPVLALLHDREDKNE